jgi:hypothetical protein
MMLTVSRRIKQFTGLACVVVCCVVLALNSIYEQRKDNNIF